MAEDTLLPNLSWLNSSEAEAIASSLATSFNIGINLVGIEKTGKGKDIVKGVAFADARAQSDATALANSKDGFVAFAFAGADAVSDTSAFAIGLNNRSKLKTGRGRDVVRGIAFANSLADASASATATAVSDFGLAVSIANSRAVAVANAFSVGIHNAHRAVIKTKAGGDVISGRAFANASASAVSETTAFVAGVLASSQAAVSTIDVSTAITVLGISNHGLLKTGIGGDLVKGVAIGSGAAWAETATAVALAIADAASEANATARASATVSTVSIGINNSGAGGKNGSISTGKGHDKLVGIGIADSASAIAAASARAQAIGQSSTGSAITFTQVKAAPTKGIGINNIDGLISLGAGKDTLEAYGHTHGLVGGSVSLGDGDDILHAGIIKKHTARGKVKAFSKTKTGALDSVKISGGKGNDQFIFHSVFGNNVSLDGGADFDELYLPGKLSKYAITAGSIGNQTLTIARNGLSMTVENIEQFHVGNQTVSFNDLV